METGGKDKDKGEGPGSPEPYCAHKFEALGDGVG
jgi:hypothetical protein